MTGVNYITNDNGEKTALFIDLVQLRKTKTLKNELIEFLDDLEDMIAVELSIGEKGRPYSDVRNEILNLKKA